MTKATQNEVKTFNLHTTGYGYLNRIREVKPKSGKPYLACSIAALHGIGDNINTTWFDCNVVSEEAIQLIDRCKKAVTENKKVLISFRLSDLTLDKFVYQTGEKKGQTGASIKARLIRVNSVKVDGELKYLRSQVTNAETNEQ